MQGHPLLLTALIALSLPAWASPAAAPAATDMPPMMQAMRARVQQIAATPDAAARQQLAERLLQDMPASCHAMMDGAGHGPMDPARMRAPAAP